VHAPARAGPPTSAGESSLAKGKTLKGRRWTMHVDHPQKMGRHAGRIAAAKDALIQPESG